MSIKHRRGSKNKDERRRMWSWAQYLFPSIPIIIKIYISFSSIILFWWNLHINNIIQDNIMVLLSEPFTVHDKRLTWCERATRRKFTRCTKYWPPATDLAHQEQMRIWAGSYHHLPEKIRTTFFRAHVVNAFSWCIPHLWLFSLLGACCDRKMLFVLSFINSFLQMCL